MFVGTVLLMLPVSSTGPPISFIDALFTATSAVCVTGLSTLDTAGAFTRFGQLVILMLIQLGGLGIMVFASALLLSMGARLSVRSTLGIRQDYAAQTSVPTTGLLKAILITTLIAEAIGAVLLFTRFVGRYDVGEALYHSVFHSVSAFCNAGFSTFSDSLMSFRNDPITLLIFAGLIILGGLGFIVVGESFSRLRDRTYRLSLHSRLCLITTLVLIVAGTLGFWAAEQSNMFRDSGLLAGLTNAFFQSVTTRTAGFNSIPQTGLTELSILLTLILMLIGGCPGSTAGGVKTTTIGILSLLVWRRFRGFRSVSAFKTSVSTDSISRSLAVLLLAVGVILIAFSFFMFLVEPPVSHQFTHGWFVENLFEVVSAFGTVGLSMGMTSHLDGMEKLVLIVLMFAGRVGLLTLGMALVKPARAGEIVYLDEDVMVG